MDENPRRLSRAESQDLTRRRLIEAARAIIVRDGVGSASVRSIAEAAGYSQGAFYSNFPGKEHLLLAVMEGHLDALARRFEAVAEAVLSSPVTAGDKSVPGEIVAFFRGLNPKGDWSTLAVELQLHANRSVEMSDRYAQMRDAFLARIGGAFDAIFRHLNVAPSICPNELAMGLVSTSVGFAIQFGGPITNETRARFMTSIVEAILSTAPAAG